MGLGGRGRKDIRLIETTRPWELEGLSRADRVIRFIECLTLTYGEERPFELRDWQKEIIRRIYDTDSEGNRYCRQSLVTMGRKNGKTQLAAALALCHLLGPESEGRGQVYSAAADKNQASLIFNELKAFIEADEALDARCNIQSFHKRIEVHLGEGKGSFYQALSSDATKAHGLNPSFVVIDELAQWKGRELYDNLMTGVGARAEPLVIAISTRSSNPHSVMSELVDYARGVESGEINDPKFVGVIFEAPQDADIWNEEIWYLANPALGDFRSLDEMRDFAAQAKRIPTKESAFRNLYLNQAVDSDERFIPAAEWKACQGKVNIEKLRGRPCWGGLDLSSTKDLTSLQLYFPFDDGAVLSYFWVPDGQLDELEEAGRVPYRTWRDQGYLITTNGRATDKYAIARELATVAHTFDLRGLAYDRWGMPDLLKILGDEGIVLPLVGWGQGFASMSPAVAAFEGAILDRKLKHPGHPVLTWNVANAVVTTDPAGNRKLDKQKAREKIDGLVALVMAVGLHSEAPPEAQDRVFGEEALGGVQWI